MRNLIVILTLLTHIAQVEAQRPTGELPPLPPGVTMNCMMAAMEAGLIAPPSEPSAGAPDMSALTRVCRNNNDTPIGPTQGGGARPQSPDQPSTQSIPVTEEHRALARLCAQKIEQSKESRTASISSQIESLREDVRSLRRGDAECPMTPMGGMPGMGGDMEMDDFDPEDMPMRGGVCGGPRVPSMESFGGPVGPNPMGPPPSFSGGMLAAGPGASSPCPSVLSEAQLAQLPTQIRIEILEVRSRVETELGEKERGLSSAQQRLDRACDRFERRCRRQARVERRQMQSPNGMNGQFSAGFAGAGNRQSPMTQLSNFSGQLNAYMGNPGVPQGINMPMNMGGNAFNGTTLWNSNGFQGITGLSNSSSNTWSAYGTPISF